jgi:hypothetical protein
MYIDVETTSLEDAFVEIAREEEKLLKGIKTANEKNDQIETEMINLNEKGEQNRVEKVDVSDEDLLKYNSIKPSSHFSK